MPANVLELSFEDGLEIRFEPDHEASNDTDHTEPDFPLHYRVLATTVHLTIFFLGVTGNAVLIAVILRTKCLQTPTYRYLLSLSFADLLVLLSAVPEAIVFHHIGRRWMADQAPVPSSSSSISSASTPAASDMVSSPHFDPEPCARTPNNVSDTWTTGPPDFSSILGFSVEIYIAICRPLISQRFCTIKRSNRIILGLWMFAVCYCAPWLGLTELKQDSSGRPQCDFRLSKEQYFYYFTADLALFYITPLVVALIIYSKIIAVLQKSVTSFKRESCRESHMPSMSVTAVGEPTTVDGVMMLVSSSGTDSEKEKETKEVLLQVAEVCAKRHLCNINGHDAEERMRGRTHVLRMLIVIVILFAVLWLPYRGLLVYNTFLERPWLNLWYLFFAKTLIYLNSAMNPFLYSAMSRRFRQALYATLACKEPFDDHTETVQGVSDFSLNRTNQNPGKTSVNISASVSQDGLQRRDGNGTLETAGL
ncbi:putative Thyrotropin-releasing hormone receptor [Hypsibius exemplaris]|uniref:Thyrotropin-releasing hormone receptor n=1 Tax=Hypsibius exemplaris TaxID=2072580 RepID=A0A1W0WVV2_HYPEX|nr:putative Thyrotropin-releasing hormone receptor [Hypsibius exemplaris]